MKRVLMLFTLTLLILTACNRGETSSISVAEIDWNDYGSLSERIAAMEVNISPFFMEMYVGPHWDLTDIFRLFSENQELLRDSPEDEDFEVVMAFFNHEYKRNPSSIRIITFYVDDALADDVLRMTIEAGMHYEQSHHVQVESIRIPLAAINWLELEENYERSIDRITVSRDGEFTEFLSGMDDIASILRFLDENQEFLQDANFDEFLPDDLPDELLGVAFNEFASKPSINITFINPTITDWVTHEFSEFLIDEEVYEQLLELIGEESWRVATERRTYFFEMNQEQRMELEEIDWQHLEENYRTYVHLLTIQNDREFFTLTGYADDMTGLFTWFETHQSLLHESEQPKETFIVHIAFEFAYNGFEIGDYTGKEAWFYIDGLLTEDFLYFIENLIWDGPDF